MRFPRQSLRPDIPVRQADDRHHWLRMLLVWGFELDGVRNRLSATSRRVRPLKRDDVATPHASTVEDVGSISFVGGRADLVPHELSKPGPIVGQGTGNPR